MPPSRRPAAGPAPVDASRARTPVYTSHGLFQGTDTVWIEHGAQRYALRRTRQGKLILTK